MRYSIDTLLKGYSRYRHDEYLKLSDAVEELFTEAEQWKATGEVQRTEIASELSDVGMAILTGSEPVTAETLTKIVEAVKPHLEGLPSKYDLDRHKRRYKQALRSQELEEKAPDSGLITFLRAMKSAGEISVSPHAVKEAGFRTQDLAKYIVLGTEEK